MKKLLVFLGLMLVFMGCENETKTTSKVFNRLDSQHSGVNFSNTLTETDSLNYLTYAYMYMGGGVSVGDINNDGLHDLFFTGNMVENKLYLNKGDLKFEDISISAGVAGDDRWYTGVTMADINDDGFLDIYCSVAGKDGVKENQLFINNGDNTFSEKAKEYGIADIGNSVQATFFDYDLDGDLDLYVANYPPTAFNAPNSYYKFKMGYVKDDETDKLYRNDGSAFVDVSEEAGIRTFGLSLSATVGDVNNDGYPDIYISNDFSSPDFFYINNGDGTFSEKVKELTAHTAFYGMGVDIADYNNDQLLDIIQVDMMAQNNRRQKANMASMNPQLFWGTVNAGFHYQYMQNNLQLNNGLMVDGDPGFSDVARLAGVSSTDWSWGPLFADLDNDGLKDLFISNGTRREINNRDFFIEYYNKKPGEVNFLEETLKIPSEKIDNFVYKNDGDLGFDQVNKEWGIEFPGFSNGVVYVDLDNDGDLEIVLNNIDDEAAIFENKSSENNNYLMVSFEGAKGNRNALGARVYVTSETQTQMHELTLSRGFQSSVAPELHFGLNQDEVVSELKVVWPDGKEEILTDVKANQELVLKYNKALAAEKADTNKGQLFAQVEEEVFPKHQHLENYYDDFVDQVLLPHKMSHFGPALAVGDLNNDGLDDYYIGASSGAAGIIYVQSADKFEKLDTKVFDQHLMYEDVGALIFDADADGDNDLYVVSGGYEFNANSELLQDRLYLNDGQGSFTYAKDALPQNFTSGSKVYEADFNDDGKSDLLVLGRQQPRNYPEAVSSAILYNVSSNGNTKFEDVTDRVAPDLKNFGMATDAVITDVNGDRKEDFIIVGEWMPIHVFVNVNDSFKDISEKMGITEDQTAWWWSIEQGDFDNDGDMDYLVGNNGLNYKYQATEEEPFELFVNDFDKNNKNDIVLSYYNEGEQYPVRGRECSSQQIPAIKSKFKDYESFSEATLVDIYTKTDLRKSTHYQVKSFSSIYLENDNGKFIIHNLPTQAQLSSINRFIVRDFNKDGNIDALIAGNLHVSEIETTRNDAAFGLLMLGDGQGNFTPQSSMESGFFAPGDVKDMSTIKVGDKEMVLIAKNSDYLQALEIK